MSARDTIAAIASAHGSAGIGIVRLSGPQARAIAETLSGRRLRPRYAHYARFRNAHGETLDRGLVLYFPAPRSYTGEDVVELHGHGNAIVLGRLLEHLYALGARPARPGEFSERAFLEGKLDLAQAEAVADLIAAGSEASARAAQRSLDGEFSRRVEALLAALIQARLQVEAAIDFPEEEIDFLSDGAVAAQLEALIEHHARLLHAAERGQRLRDGRVIAIVGRPNAGKSSLLNALAGSDRAIVTDIAGTTRDVLREQVRLGPLELTLIDTAGLRDSSDAIEAEGVRRARVELARADHALVVIDAAAEDAALADVSAEVPAAVARTVVFNKIDLQEQAPRCEGSASETRIHLSAKTGAGLELLIAHLTELAGADGDQDGAFSARARHVEALRRTGDHLHAARDRLHHERAGELVAEELRQAQQTLAEITGAYRADDLLGAIFGSFCIGK